MATVFPYNLLPQAPAQVENILMPILLEQQNKLLGLAFDLAQDLINLAVGATCDDPSIAEIKNKINEIKNIIENIRAILQIIPVILSIFDILKTVGTIISLIIIILPAVVGKPEGPNVAGLTAAAELIENITPVGNKLSGAVGDFQLIFGKVGNVILEADSVLQSLGGPCSDGVDLADTGAFGGLDPLDSQAGGAGSPGALDGGVFINDTDFFSQFDNSDFYQDVNVSDPDLQSRIDLIFDIIQETANTTPIAINELINEAPSNVFIQVGPPSNSEGQLGDYWIDSSTQQVYGPKPSDTSWS
jgi:hypothetical protein